MAGTFIRWFARTSVPERHFKAFAQSGNGLHHQIRGCFIAVESECGVTLKFFISLWSGPGWQGRLTDAPVFLCQSGRSNTQGAFRSAARYPLR